MNKNDEAPNPEEIQQAIHKGFLWGAGSIVILIALGTLLARQEWISETVWEALRQADIALLLLGWLCMCFAIFVLGYRWKVLLPDNHNISGSFLGVCLGGALLLNYAIPGPFGEVVSVWILKRRYGVNFAAGITSASVARLLGLLTAALLSLCFWPFVALSTQEAESIITGLMIGIVVGSVLLILFFTLPQKLLQMLSSYEKNSLKMIKKFLNSIDYHSKNGIKPFFKATAWSLLGHSIAFLGIWLSLQALLPSTPWQGIAFTYAVGTCCGAIAFLIPGSQLAWDAIFASLLSASTQYTLEEAAILTGTLRIEQLLMMIVGGIGLIILVLPKEKHTV